MVPAWVKGALCLCRALCLFHFEAEEPGVCLEVARAQAGAQPAEFEGRSLFAFQFPKEAAPEQLQAVAAAALAKAFQEQGLVVGQDRRAVFPSQSAVGRCAAVLSREQVERAGLRPGQIEEHVSRWSGPESCELLPEWELE